MSEWNKKMIPSESTIKGIGIGLLVASFISLPIMFFHRPSWNQGEHISFVATLSEIAQLTPVLFASCSAVAGIAMIKSGYASGRWLMIAGLVSMLLFIALFAWIRIG